MAEAMNFPGTTAWTFPANTITVKPKVDACLGMYRLGSAVFPSIR